jgi:hypothetical protein
VILEPLTLEIISGYSSYFTIFIYPTHSESLDSGQLYGIPSLRNPQNLKKASLPKTTQTKSMIHDEGNPGLSATALHPPNVESLW